MKFKIQIVTYIFVGIFGLVMLISCQNSNDGLRINHVNISDEFIYQEAKKYFKPLNIPDSLYHNEIDSTLVLFGQQLFYDTKLSLSGEISCNTCHSIENYGMDGRQTAVGHNRRVGKRNTPTVFNSFLQYAQFWDARASTVEEQMFEPLLDPSEMAMKDTLDILNYVNQSYQSIIRRIFMQPSIGAHEIKKSIGAFERTLITPSRFDTYLKGQIDVLSHKEKQGLLYFIEEGCVTCHNGVLLGGNMAQKFGIYGHYWEYTNSDIFDEGVYSISQNPSDKFLFKVPSLRNVAQTAPYFHDGSVKDLNTAISIMAELELGKKLSNEKIEKIEEFLHCLTGELIDYKAPE